MDWLMDHFEVWFLIAVAIVAILRKLKGLPSGETGSGRTEADPEAAERTRRIQEEIRRRILERRGLTRPPPVFAEMGEKETEEIPLPAPPRPMTITPPREPIPTADYTPELERQQTLIRQLDEMRGRPPVRAGGAPLDTGAAPGMAALMAPDCGRWAELRQPAGLRRAIIWREILGPPVGLR